MCNSVLLVYSQSCATLAPKETWSPPTVAPHPAWPCLPASSDLGLFVQVSASSPWVLGKRPDLQDPERARSQGWVTGRPSGLRAVPAGSKCSMLIGGGLSWGAEPCYFPRRLTHTSTTVLAPLII